MPAPRSAVLWVVLCLFVPVAVCAQTPVVSISPASLTFPTIMATAGQNNQSGLATYLTNTGDAPLSITSVAASGDYFASSFCGSTLAPGTTCQINVNFAPTTAGLRTGMVSITDNAGDSPQMIPLSGYGTWLNLSTYSLSFPLQLVNTSSSPLAVTVTNTGSQAIPLGAFTVSGDFTQTNNCGGSIAAGLACTISVTFAPTADGVRSGSLGFSDNSPDGGGTISIALNGSATWLTTSPQALAFPFQAVNTSSAPLPLVIQNTATIPVTLSLEFKVKPPIGNSDFSQTNNCGTVLAGGASCTANVVYTPSAPGGSYNSLLITSDGVTLSIPCSALKTWFKTDVSSLSFPAQAVGTASAPQTVTLTNNSSSAQNLSPLFSPGSSFSETDTCGGSVAAGASCTLSVMFIPTMLGSLSDTLTTGGVPIVSVSGTGVWESLSPASLSFPPQVVGTTSAPQTITLTNASNATQNVAVNAYGPPGLSSYAQTNNCGSTLAAGASCTINVTFTPGVAGAQKGFVAFELFGGPSVALSGTGTYVSVMPAALSFGAQDVGTSSPAQIITVTNTSSGDIAFSNISATGDYTQSNNCPAGMLGSILAAGTSCTVTVTFTPTAVGTRTGTLTLADSDAGSPQTVAFSGSGSGLSANPSNLSFSMQLIGTASAPQAVTLTNVGGSSRNLSLSFSSAGFTQTNNCGTALAPGASCRVNISFAPSALNMQNATLSNGGSSIVSVSGIGIWQKITPGSLVFPLQLLGTTSAPQTLTVTNVSSAAQNLSLSLSSSGFVPSFSQTNNCPNPLPAGASCTANVTFTPSAAGAQNGSLYVVSGLMLAPQVSLSGVGTSISITPSALTFAAQAVGGTSPAQTITVTNTSSAGVTFSSITASGDFAQNTNCPANGTPLAANASCTISVTFSPTAGGARTGALVVNDSDPGSPQTAVLSGTGIAPTAQVSPTTLTFSAQGVGNSSTPQTVTITNTGASGSSLQISGVTTTGDFSQTNNCTVALSAGSSCTVNLVFTPTSTGARTGALSIADNAANSPQTVSLSGTGASGVSPRAVSLTPGQTQQFTTIVATPTWAVDGIAGGSATVGTITATGLYTAPAVAGIYNITATSGAQQAGANVYVENLAGVYTYHYDNARTGQNTSEIALTPQTVNPTNFGKLFSLPVDGQVYAQPLYVQGVTIPGKGKHNVLFVATEHDSVYAFDAESNSGTNASPLWKASLIPAGGSTVSTSDAGCSNITPEIGITGTPVIDPASGTIYVVSKTKESGKFFQRLHALDITTGKEKFGGPRVIQASVPGTGDGSSGGVVSFNALRENNRAGLLLQNGLVYIGWASHCDHGPYHGWVLAYNAQTLARTGVFNTSPNTGLTGIWMGGGGLAGDGTNVFFATGNGTFDVNTGGKSYGDSILGLGAPNAGALPVGSYFTPFNQSSLNNVDLDVGSGGVLLLPTQTGAHPHLLVQVGKEGTIHLVDRDTMGGYCSACQTTDTQIVQELRHAIGGIWGVPAFWNNNLYFGGSGDYVRAFSFDAAGDGLIAGPTSSGSAKANGYGPTPSVSANGTNDGIVWVIQAGTTEVLRAMDATSLSVELYNSAQSSNLGKAVKFSVPTIVNGKVYVGTQSQIDVYGLLP